MRHAGNISGIAFIIILFIFLVYAELWFFDTYPSQLPDGVTMEQWKASFQMWAFICVASAGLASLLWYLFAQCTFKINRWEDSRKRPQWILCFILPSAAIVFSVIFVKKAEGGLRAEQLIFFVVNGLLSYYLSTLLFSPSAFKYIPIGAKRIRHW